MKSFESVHSNDQQIVWSGGEGAVIIQYKALWIWFCLGGVFFFYRQLTYRVFFYYFRKCNFFSCSPNRPDEEREFLLPPKREVVIAQTFSWVKKVHQQGWKRGPLFQSYVKFTGKAAHRKRGQWSSSQQALVKKPHIPFAVPWVSQLPN